MSKQTTLLCMPLLHSVLAEAFGNHSFRSFHSVQQNLIAILNCCGICMAHRCITGNGLSWRHGWQIEGGFSQPNGFMCRKMLQWARDVTQGSQDRDLLELYCGNGNFTVALAGNFRYHSHRSFLAMHCKVDCCTTSDIEPSFISSFCQAVKPEREVLMLLAMAISKRKGPPRTFLSVLSKAEPLR